MLQPDSSFAIDPIHEDHVTFRQTMAATCDPYPAYSGRCLTDTRRLQRGYTLAGSISRPAFDPYVPYLMADLANMSDPDDGNASFGAALVPPSANFVPDPWSYQMGTQSTHSQIAFPEWMMGPAFEPMLPYSEVYATGMVDQHTQQGDPSQEMITAQSLAMVPAYTRNSPPMVNFEAFAAPKDRQYLQPYLTPRGGLMTPLWTTSNDPAVPVGNICPVVGSNGLHQDPENAMIVRSELGRRAMPSDPTFWSASPVGRQIPAPQHTLSANAAHNLADFGTVANSQLNCSSGELLPSFVHRDEARHRGQDQQLSYEAKDLPGFHTTVGTTWRGAGNNVHGARPSRRR